MINPPVTIHQRFRGDGTTTKQIQFAPLDAIFIWCDERIEYPTRIAIALGRRDLKIMPRSVLQQDCLRLRGIYGRRIVVDHATRLTEREHQGLMMTTRGDGYL